MLDTDHVAFSEVVNAECPVDLAVAPHRHYVTEATGEFDDRIIVLAAVGSDCTDLTDDRFAGVEVKPLCLVIVVLFVRLDRVEIVEFGVSLADILR